MAVPFVHCLKIQFQTLSLLITKWGGSKFSRSKGFEKNLQQKREIPNRLNEKKQTTNVAATNGAAKNGVRIYSLRCFVISNFPEILLWENLKRPPIS